MAATLVDRIAALFQRFVEISDEASEEELRALDPRDVEWMRQHGNTDPMKDRPCCCLKDDMERLGMRRVVAPMLPREGRPFPESQMRLNGWQLILGYSLHADGYMEMWIGGEDVEEYPVSVPKLRQALLEAGFAQVNIR